MISSRIEGLALPVLISLKVPAQTQTGKIFRIKGKGASVVRDSRRGDILCRVVVETPSNLDKNQIKLLNEGDDTDTIGGLVVSIAGRVPQRGEIIKHQAGMVFTIIDADPRRIKTIKISLPK